MVLSDWAGPRRVDDRWRNEFVLLDRHAERAAIDQVLTSARSGLSGLVELDHNAAGVLATIGS